MGLPSPHLALLSAALCATVAILVRRRRDPRRARPSFVPHPETIHFADEPYYFPFTETTPEKMYSRMGVKRLPQEEWIEIGETYLTQMFMKKKILREHRDMVWVSKESKNTELAKREVLDTLVAHLLEYFPSIFKLQGDYICNYATGDSWKVKGAHLDVDPLEIASLLVQEDLVILEPEGEQIILTAGCVCFPSKWNVKEKFMQNLPLVHEPVPPFEKQLSNPVMRALHDLTPKSGIWRVNWSILDDLSSQLDLYLPTGRAKQEPAVTEVEKVGEKMMYRAERQTLTRMPKTNAILFTIRTYQRPLQDIVTKHREVVPQLIAAVQRMDPNMKPYKSGQFWMDVCCKYLAAQIESPSNGPISVTLQS